MLRFLLIVLENKITRSNSFLNEALIATSFASSLTCSFVYEEFIIPFFLLFFIYYLFILFTYFFFRINVTFFSEITSDTVLFSYSKPFRKRAKENIQHNPVISNRKLQQNRWTSTGRRIASVVVDSACSVKQQDFFSPQLYPLHVFEHCKRCTYETNKVKENSCRINAILIFLGDT